MERCTWCLCNEKMIDYHDKEWGVPLSDDQKQFEFLMMEVMQCGLNWNMMIQKREIFRECFDNFDFQKVAFYTEEDIERIMQKEGMIKSRRKIEAVIHNAQCFIKVREEFGSFSSYLWKFSQGKTILYMGHQKGRLPARNGLSDTVSSNFPAAPLHQFYCVLPYVHYNKCRTVLSFCFRGRIGLTADSPHTPADMHR